MKHLLITTIAAVLVVGCGSISIHQAAEKGRIEMVKQHLAAGADVNAKNENGDNPLHEAAASGHTEVVELIIANGADVNAKSSGGWTPMRVATMFDHKEIAELLIAEGADVNAKRKWSSRTPLDWAIRDKRNEIAALLRKHGGKTGEELKAEGK